MSFPRSMPIVPVRLHEKHAMKFQFSHVSQPYGVLRLPAFHPTACAQVGNLEPAQQGKRTQRYVRSGLYCPTLQRPGGRLRVSSLLLSIAPVSRAKQEEHWVTSPTRDLQFERTHLSQPTPRNGYGWGRFLRLSPATRYTQAPVRWAPRCDTA